MFKKPVWDELSILTWCIILLEVFIRRWVHCVIKGWTCSGTIHSSGKLWCLKRCSIGTKEPKVCQENIPHTITPPPSAPAWTVDTRQDGSMLSCFLRQILTLPSEYRSGNRDSSDQATFFQSSIVQLWWACALGVVFCCCSPSASGFDVLCVQRWYSAYLGCNEWLLELLFYHL